MSPDTPGTPDEGTVDDAKVSQEAAEAKETTAKKPAAKKAAPKAKAKAKAKPKPEAKAKPKAKAKPAAKEAAKPAAKAKPAPKQEAKPAPAAKGKPKPTAKAKAKPAPRGRRRDRDAGELVIVRASARYVRSSARKARLVCDGIRGKSVDEARAILAFSPRQVAEAWTKLLESAVANAENNHELDGADLKVHAVFADEGPTLKRFRPRAMGRATRIRKRTSHLTIQLTPKA
jgi:ribosomal protein L22